MASSKGGAAFKEALSLADATTAELDGSVDRDDIAKALGCSVAGGESSTDSKSRRSSQTCSGRRREKRMATFAAPHREEALCSRDKKAADAVQEVIAAAQEHALTKEELMEIRYTTRAPPSWCGNRSRSDNAVFREGSCTQER